MSKSYSTVNHYKVANHYNVANHYGGDSRPVYRDKTNESRYKKRPERKTDSSRIGFSQSERNNGRSEESQRYSSDYSSTRTNASDFDMESFMSFNIGMG